MVREPRDGGGVPAAPTKRVAASAVYQEPEWDHPAPASFCAGALEGEVMQVRFMSMQRVLWNRLSNVRKPPDETRIFGSAIPGAAMITLIRSSGLCLSS